MGTDEEPKESEEINEKDGRCHGCGKIRHLKRVQAKWLCVYCEGREEKRLGLKVRPRRK